MSLYNLAALLQNHPERLTEARQLAEEALGIMNTLDPGAAKIWMAYTLLADIVEQEASLITENGQQAELRTQGREYRRLARGAKRNFAGTRHELQGHLGLIMATVLATQEQEQRYQLENLLRERDDHGWTSLVAAIRRVLAGERDADLLCEDLDLEDSVIVETILTALEDPFTLADLLYANSPDV
ncbi:hypothetical protein BH24GEM3_BH24GEM3_10970 [soil metagenome]